MRDGYVAKGHWHAREDVGLKERPVALSQVGGVFDKDGLIGDSIVIEAERRTVVNSQVRVHDDVREHGEAEEHAAIIWTAA